MDSQINYMPPNNFEAEQAVLGSILLNSETLVQAMEYLVPVDFYRRAHQLIFSAMIALNNENEPIDVVTLADYLEKKEQIEDIGGPSYLAELASSVPTSANIEHYARLVEERSLLRRLIQASNDIITSSYEEKERVLDIIDEAERRILEVSEHKSRSGFVKIDQVLSKCHL